MNFVRDVVAARGADELALLELSRDGGRREWTFGEVLDRSERLAGTLARLGVVPGDVVMTVIGNRPEWVFTMLACFRMGAVVLPCTEQLRSRDLASRVAQTMPKVVVLDERNRLEMELALTGAPATQVLSFPGDALFTGPAGMPYVDLAPTDPCLMMFTSGTAGEPKAVVHGHRYLVGQQLQADHWIAPSPGDIVWCTAAAGWSKSARNVFVAPWLRGASAVLHDARFDPRERLELIDRERINVLCMAPTEYRVIAKRATLRRLGSLHGMVAAGEALNPDVLRVWKEATGLAVRDGYGQTETGQLTTNAPRREPRAGSMGVPLPGVRLRVEDGELVVDPRTVPTFFLGYRGGEPSPTERYRTGDRVSMDDDGYLYFEGRADDIIISAGYRIGPFEVESALVEHAQVAEAAVVAAPDEERGSIVHAVVVLRDAGLASDQLARELQDHVKARTAPYKYPRRISFAASLPKTSSGKVQRALLRREAAEG